MKKVLLSLALVFTFGVYVFHQKTDDETNAPVLLPNQQATASNTSDQTGNPTSTSATTGGYKDGAYTGDVADAFYGNIQVQATISGGKISDIAFLQYPNDRGTSIEINRQAMPYLQQEAIQAQNADVNTISGATQTSQAFRLSLQSALSKAQ